MSEKPLLLPAPRFLSVQDGELALADEKLIVLDTADGQALWFTAVSLQSALSQLAGVNWEIVAGAVPYEQTGVTLSIAPGSVQNREGYSLTITAEAIYIVANEAAGAFYGVMTLRQLLRQYGRSLPTLRLTDWPDFPNRGVMFDISRDRVPTMDTLYQLIDMLAAWKINQFQLYTEHTFAYRHHPVVWAAASPMTGEQILALDAYCRQRFMELVPNQNSFGHMRPWLTHDAYRHLAECPDGCDTHWGHFDEPFSLCPAEPGSLELIRSLYDELLPHFRSTQFNVGLDETVDLGNGRSQADVAQRGVGRVYLDFLRQIYREVKARGRTMQFWGDVIIKHPDLVAELPRDLIALEWGYEADHPFDQHGAIFANSGVPFYVCPGTSTWVTVAGRTDNALENLRNAARNGRQHGAVGYLITDWGDMGHWQPLPVSYLGFGYGAALAWGVDNNETIDIAAILSRDIFQDETGTMGQLVYDLGNVYQIPGVASPNSSILARILLATPDNWSQRVAQLERWAGKKIVLTREKLTETAVALQTILRRLPTAHMQCPDAHLITRELTWAGEMLQHGCHRALWMVHGAGDTAALTADAGRLIAEYKEIWHQRSRPGGFIDSVARLEKMKASYS